MRLQSSEGYNMKILRASATLPILFCMSAHAVAQPQPTPVGHLMDRVVRIATPDGRGETVLAAGAVGCRSISQGIAGWSWSDGSPEIVVRDLPPTALAPLSMMLTVAVDGAAPRGEALAPFLRERALSPWRQGQTEGAGGQERAKDGLVAVLRGADLLGCDFATKAVAQELASQIKGGSMTKADVLDRLPGDSGALLKDVADQYDALYDEKLPPS